MIKSIEFADHALIENFTLDVGNINVFCGKNSSGKTAALTAIASLMKEAGSQGVSSDLLISHEDIKKLFIDIPIHQSELWNSIVTILAEYEYSKARNESQEYLIPTEELRYQIDQVKSQQRLNKFISDFKGVAEAYKTKLVMEFLAHRMGEENWVLFAPDVRRQDVQARKDISHANNVEPEKWLVTTLSNWHDASHVHDDPQNLKKAFNLVEDAFRTVSKNFEFEVTRTETEAKILKFSRIGIDQWVPADKCGLGLTQLLHIITMSLSPSTRVVIVDEIQANLHPELQRELLQFFHTLTSKKFFLSTHSNVFLSTEYVDKVFYCELKGTVDRKDTKDTIRITNSTSRAEILNDLGYSISDSLTADCHILVEGPTDQQVLEYFLRKKEPSIRHCNIHYMYLHGSSMKYADLSHLVGTTNSIAVVDNEDSQDKTVNAFVKKCKSANIPVHKHERYAIENYFTVEAVKDVGFIPIDQELTAFAAGQAVGKQVFMRGQPRPEPEPLVKCPAGCKATKSKGVNIKAKNKDIVKSMSLDDIASTDLIELVDKIVEICKRERPSVFKADV